MEKSRTKNTTRNICAGLLNQAVSIILPFINRTAMLWILGADFTGLSSLFTSILHVLNIAELGFNTAIVYSLYKPMAENNHKKICEIVSLFKKIYNIVGTAVLSIGLLILPILPKLINGPYPNTINIYIVYLLYLINSAISYYLFAYKESLLIADQRQDVAKNIRTIANIVIYIAQFILLFLTKNLYLYLLAQIVGTVMINVMICVETNKRYPYYKYQRTKHRISKDLRRQVGGLMINKICDTFRNSFDNLIISSFIGLTATAIYGNYYYIYSALYGTMLVICTAMGASIGNSIIKKSRDSNYKDMLTFSQLFAGILGTFTILMACLYQPFIKIWTGEKLMLPETDMLLFCVYFYIINLNNIRNQYISGTGMWWKLKSSYIIEAIANLLLNIVLGKILGITGVILATIITIFIFNYLQRNRILFKYYFNNQSLSMFYKEQLYYAVLTGIGFILSYIACNSITFQGFISIILRIIISISIPSIIFYLGIRHTKRYQNSIIIIKRIKKYILRKT